MDKNAADKVKLPKNPNWEKDELIVTLDFYLQYKGNPPAKTSPEIKNLSDTLNQLSPYLSDTNNTYRNPNGVYMKLMNFRRFDSVYVDAGKKGLERGGKLEEVVWNTYADNPPLCHELATTIVDNADSSARSGIADETIEEAAEGRILTRVHSFRERNPKLTAVCKKQFRKKHGELYCEACGLRPSKKYGSDFEQIIECHHKKPLHTLAPDNKTKVSDLALLCASCHRAIHSQKPWLSIEQLTKLIKLRA